MGIKRNGKRKHIVTLPIILFLILSLIQIYPINSIISKNVDASSTWIQTSDEDFNNGELNNIVIKGMGSNSNLQLTRGQWNNMTPSTQPPPRQWHEMSTVYNDDKVILFGGTDGENFYNDTWVYDLSDNLWKDISLPINNPSERSGHAMATFYNTDKVLLFGGSDWGNTETWIFDLSDKKWTQKNPTNNPSYRKLHEMAAIHGDDKILLYGGHTDKTDTWIYNLSNNQWTNMNPSNHPSFSWGFGMATIYGDDKVVAFGGGKDETWIYDLSDNKWTNIMPANSPPEYTNNELVSIYNNDKVLLWSGIYADDFTWIYDLSENKWTKTVTTNYPDSRECYALATLYNSNKVVLFSGYLYEDNWYMCQDTWVFTYGYSESGYFISQAYDTSTSSAFNSINWNATTNSNTSVKFQLKTSTQFSELYFEYFIGPDGTNSTYYTTSGTKIWIGHHGDSWLQYKAYLSTTNNTQTPILHETILLYNCLPNRPTLISPSNGLWTNNVKPEFSWIFKDLDSSAQAGFQWQANNNGEFSSIVYDSDEVYLPKSSFIPEEPLVDGTWYWRVRTLDNDGGWGQFSSPWTVNIDTKPPNSTITMPVNNDFYYSLNQISGFASDPVTNTSISKVEIAIKRQNDNYYWNEFNWVSSETWILTNGTINWVYFSNLITWQSGEYLIKSRAMDLASNIEIPGNGIIFNIDKDKPSSTIIIPKNNSFINKLNSVIGNSTDNDGAGINKIEISIERDNDNRFWNGESWKSFEYWLKVNGKEIWSYDTSNIKWATDTEYIIFTRAIDNVGNMEVSDNGFKFMFDNEPPEISFLINNGDKYTNMSNVTLTIQAEDTGSGIYQMSTSSDDFSWSTWKKFTPIKPYNLTSNDGEKRVYCRVNDKANNTAMINDTIVLDSTPPYSLSILINNGSSVTFSALVYLTLSAKDNLSGLSKMCFSVDRKNWSLWENYTENKVYNLSTTNDVNTIYFKVKDRAGNIADPVLASILFKSQDKKESNDKTDKDTVAIISMVVLIIILIIIFIFLICIYFKKEKPPKK